MLDLKNVITNDNIICDLIDAAAIASKINCRGKNCKSYGASISCRECLKKIHVSCDTEQPSYLFYVEYMVDTKTGPPILKDSVLYLCGCHKELEILLKDYGDEIRSNSTVSRTVAVKSLSENAKIAVAKMFEKFGVLIFESVKLDGKCHVMPYHILPSTWA